MNPRATGRCKAAACIAQGYDPGSYLRTDGHSRDIPWDLDSLDSVHRKKRRRERRRLARQRQRKRQRAMSRKSSLSHVTRRFKSGATSEEKKDEQQLIV